VTPPIIPPFPDSQRSDKGVKPKSREEEPAKAKGNDRKEWHDNDAKERKPRREGKKSFKMKEKGIRPEGA